MTVIRLDAFDDPRLDDYRSVRDPVLARDRGLFVAEGRLVVTRALAGRRYAIESLLLTETTLAAMSPLLEDIAGDPPIYVGTPSVLEGVVGYNVHRGCLALGRRPPLRAPASVLALARTVVMLDGVANADNVGAVFRNALAFGADAVLLGPGCCDPLYRKAIRTSMAATLDVPFALLTDWSTGLEALRGSGFSVAALTPGGAGRGGTAAAIETLESFVKNRGRHRVALLLGSEGHGLTSSSTAWADCYVSIPMAAGVDSVNVAVAAGIALARLFEERMRLGQEER